MRNFFTVVKMLLRHMFKIDRTKKQGGLRVLALVGLGVAYAFIEFLFVYLARVLGKTAEALQMQSELMTMLFIFSIVVVFVFGVVAVLNNLYFSRDTEFFSALPLRPHVVYAAKLFVVYVCETATMALIVLPCAITAAIYMHVVPLFYVLLPFLVVLTPCIPLFLAAIIAVPIMYLVSFFKKRGAVGSIVGVLLLAGFIAAYYVLMSRMQNALLAGDGTQILENMRKALTVVCNVFYPVFAAVKAALFVPSYGFLAGAALPLHLLVFLGSIAALLGLSIALSSAVYRRGAAVQLEGTRSEKQAVRVYKSAGASKAIFKKEWRELVRTPAFALQCLAGVIICPLMLGLSAFMSDVSGAVSLGKVYGDVMRFIFLWIILAMGAGMNSGASTSFTREGDKFCYCKLLPVSARTLVKAKSYLYLLLGAIGSALGFIVLCILAFDLSFVLLGGVFVLLYAVSFVHFAMWFDLKKPKLDWKTPNEAVKHSINVMVPMFGNMAFSGLLCAGALVIYYFMGKAGLSRALCLTVPWIFMYAAMLSVCITFGVLLYRTCEQNLDRISV